MRMHRDLQIRDLKDDDRHPAFVIVGQPEICIHDEPNDEVSRRVARLRHLRPRHRHCQGRQPRRTSPAGCSDTAYDGTSFFARRIHFPNAHDDRQIKKLRAQLGRSLDKIRWDAALSIQSAPFPKPPEGRIAIKIITTTGNRNVSSGRCTLTAAIWRATSCLAEGTSRTNSSSIPAVVCHPVAHIRRVGAPSRRCRRQRSNRLTLRHRGQVKQRGYCA